MARNGAEFPSFSWTSLLVSLIKAGQVPTIWLPLSTRSIRLLTSKERTQLVAALRIRMSVAARTIP